MIFFRGWTKCCIFLGETFFVDYPMPPDASHAESRATHVGQFGGADEFLEMPKGMEAGPKLCCFFFLFFPFISQFSPTS